ncbi:ABC transporter permease [Streptomyces nodosus]|uniref:Transporter n=1 Tax=Streptomyces nodosus TaxID=40318 RepID=A0A5P2VWM1_9ACTN|nr:ABC transporter permease subunit [Streptomyces nodosus]MBB4790076.1 tryptophan-rich sensory protein [Streptomyces nodosus]QEV37788.1 transporter [Streptomyces nodosus]
MSAQTLSAGTRTSPVASPSGLLRTMTRRHRPLFLAAGLVLLAVLGWAAADRAALFRASGEAHACIRAGGNCDAAFAQLANAETALQYFQFALMALPLLMGAFIGAPLIAQELERGTHRLMLTQSLSRARWLTAQLAVPAAVVLVTAVGCSLAAAWVRSAARGATAQNYWGRWETPVYSTFGIVPVAFALLALAVGILMGLLVRRTLPAMGLTLLLCAGLDALFLWVRPHLLPVRTWVGHGGYQLKGEVWMLSDGVVRADGSWLPYHRCPTPSGCRTGTVFEQYHSQDQFWPMQGVESALLLICAVAAVAVTCAVVRRRAF